MFVDEMNSDCFQLLGMAERSMLPEVFTRRSRHRIPIIGILFSAPGVILLCFLSFDEIVAAENFLYCFGILMEFKAFVKLKYLSAYWPYKVPVGTRYSRSSVDVCSPNSLNFGGFSACLSKSYGFQSICSPGWACNAVLSKLL